MTREEMMQDLQLYVFRDKDSALIKELTAKVAATEIDDLDRAVYTGALRKVQVAYDTAKYYYNFLVDTFMDVDYALETTEDYMECTLNEIEVILQSFKIVETAK